MKSKFQQNAIISGYINSFCLVCECHLDSEAVALWHIEQYEHKKNLKSYPYLEKYKTDSIRKLKNGYFCEYCNKLIGTKSRVSLHIREREHNENKIYKSFQRINGSIIAFQKIIIDEKAWHSLSDQTCIICNIDFDNEEMHKSDGTHVIKLVQSTIKLHVNGVYRIVDDDIYQCLTCNTLLMYHKVDEHFNGADHLNLYAGCQRTVENKCGAIRKQEKEKKIKEMVESYFFGIEPQPETEDLTDDEFLGYFPTDMPGTSDSDLVMYLRSDNGEIELSQGKAEAKNNTVASPKIFNNNDGTSNFNFRRNSTETFEGKKQDEEPPILMCNLQEFEIANIESTYRNAPPIYRSTGTDHNDSPEAFALHNFMVMLKPQAGHVFCKLCMFKVRFSLEDMKRHVTTRKHISIVVRTAFHDVSTRASGSTLPVREPTPFRMPMIDFIFDSRYTQDQYDVVVNKAFCVTVASYNLLYHVSTTHMLCHVCNYKKPFNDPDSHLDKSFKHITGMNLSLVLTELKEEFIREISTNKFHCGFCNIVLPSFRDLKDHLKGGNHKEQKISAYQRLHRTWPRAGILQAISAIENNRTFTPSWVGRPIPGTY